MTITELIGMVIDVWGVLALILAACYIAGAFWSGVEGSKWYMSWKAMRYGVTVADIIRDTCREWRRKKSGKVDSSFNNGSKS